MTRPLVLIKGAGDLATGVAFRFWHSRFPVVMTELEVPLCVRRTVSFAEAITLGRHTVEGVTAVRAVTRADMAAALARREIPVVVDPEAALIRHLSPGVVVDAIMAKCNTGTALTDARVVVALGPGFTVGADCHAAVETLRGPLLGQVLYTGSAAPDTGTPGEVAGIAGDRVLRVPASGCFQAACEIGEMVTAGQVVGMVMPDSGREPLPVTTPIGGVLRGLIGSGTHVLASLKVGDVDPTGDRRRCYTISDKALAVGGGVLEAVLHLMP